MKFNQIINKVPKIGGEKPQTNISAEQQQLSVLGEVGQKVKKVIDDLERYLLDYGYENAVDNAAKFLQRAIIEAGLVNKEVPLVWQLFEQRYKDKMAKLSIAEQDSAFQFNNYAPIWNRMGQWHNLALQNTNFEQFYGQNFNDDTKKEANEQEEVKEA